MIGVLIENPYPPIYEPISKVYIASTNSATIPLSPQFRHGAIGVTPARLADNTMKTHSEHYVCAWAQRESNPHKPLRPIRPFKVGSFKIKIVKFVFIRFFRIIVPPVHNQSDCGGTYQSGMYSIINQISMITMSGATPLIASICSSIILFLYSSMASLAPADTRERETSRPSTSA